MQLHLRTIYNCINIPIEISPNETLGNIIKYSGDLLCATHEIISIVYMGHNYRLDKYSELQLADIGVLNNSTIYLISKIRQDNVQNSRQNGNVSPKTVSSIAPQYSLSNESESKILSSPLAAINAPKQSSDAQLEKEKNEPHIIPNEPEKTSKYTNEQPPTKELSPTDSDNSLTSEDEIKIAEIMDIVNIYNVETVLRIYKKYNGDTTASINALLDSEYV